MTLFRYHLIAFLGGLFVTVFAVLGMAHNASAAMRFCNRTEVPIDTALGYRSSEGWVSEGWWQLGAGECARVYGEPLTERFYFYYATSLVKPAKDIAPFIWSGKYEFCTNAKPFKITGDGDCQSRAYDTKGFQQIDVGKSTRDYTLDFKEDGSGR